jgi:hypothetical protein
MDIPGAQQTVHMMNWWDVVNVRRKMSGRNAAELKLWTTDDLRHLYQGNSSNLIKLSDGLIDRAELVAEIRWRVLWSRISYFILLLVSLIAAIGAVFAAIEGWKGT